MTHQLELYDRRLLLLGAKRNAILELWEVRRYGMDSYDDADYVSIYGMPPAEWHRNGARLLGRTAVECTRDRLGDTIAKDVAEIASSRTALGRVLIIDLFAGSGNTLYWLSQYFPNVRGIGFESDAEVFRLTRHNIAALALPIDILNTDYVDGLDGVSLPPDDLLITFIAPPWGDALDEASGLDLRRTTPAIPDVVDYLLHKYPGNGHLCVIQVYEMVVPASMAELRARFDWSTIRMDASNMPGKNHGILLGTKGWVPQAVDAS